MNDKYFFNITDSDERPDGKTDGVFYGSYAKSSEFNRPIETVESDHVKAAAEIRVLMGRVDRTVRALMYVVAVAGYRLAQRLRDEPELWESFQNEKFWVGHSKLSAEGLLRYAIMYLYGSHQSQIAERARDHARALEPYFKANKPAFEVLPCLNEDGGFRGGKSKARDMTRTSSRKALAKSRAAADTTSAIPLEASDHFLVEFKMLAVGDEWTIHAKKSIIGGQPSLVITSTGARRYH